jgi:hypothetical protein
MKVIYDEVYSGSRSIVLHYQELIRNQVSTQGAGVMEMHLVKVLKVYQKHLWYWKESDQRRRSKHIAEKKECVETKTSKAEKKESDEKIAMKTSKTIPGNKTMQLFTLLPMKRSFTMSNILIQDSSARLDVG